MPKSKRNKIISLTATNKKGHTLKQKSITEIRDAVAKYDRLFVFTYTNMRSRLMKDVRMEFRDDSRFFMGKNKVMQIALGTTDETEVADNLKRVSRHLRGQCGLLATNRDKQAVLDYFESMEVPEYANAGFVAQKTRSLPKGPTQWPVSMMEQLRKLGLMAEVENAQLVLRKSFAMCRKGHPITPEQAKVLELCEIKIATFKITLTCCWSQDDYDEYVAPIAKGAVIESGEAEKGSDDDNADVEGDDTMET